MRQVRGMAVAAAALALVATAPVAAGWFGSTVKGSGKIVSESRTLAPFDRVGSSGSADVIVTVGGAQSVIVKADDNVVPLIETKVENGRLTIGSKGGYDTDAEVTITITVPALKGASLSGSGDMTVSGVAGESFDAALAGSGDITATGQAGKVSVSVAGSGDVHLFGLTAGKAEVSIAGSGDVEINATDLLSASIAGSGDVTYKGKPELKRSIAGSGELRPASAS